MTLNNINAITLGSSEINTIYLGTNIIWTKNNSNQNEEDENNSENENSN